MRYPQFSKSDISAFHKSCRIAVQTFEAIKKLIQPGWTEKETASRINFLMKKLGADGLAFRPIVAAGNHSAIPHHRPTTRKIKKNDIVLLDFGCRVNGICSDISRTIFIGKSKPEWKKIYRIVSTAQQKALKQLSNETMKQSNNEFMRARELDFVARDYIKKKGYGKNFVHGLGHGIGTRPHQYFSIKPKSRAFIKPGFVFTIEPGIYLKNRFGVRIEDIIYISKKGKLQVLTNFRNSDILKT